MKKNDLRSHYKIIRDRLPLRKRKLASRKIMGRLLKLPLFQSAKSIGLYRHTGSEVETLNLLKKCLALKKIVGAPRVNKKNHTIDFIQVKSLKDFKKGTYDILEPKEMEPVLEPKAIDLFLIPGILFDRKGHRLGYGKGYYDRFLKFLSGSLTVGLTYDKTLVDRLPNHSRDIPVSYVITEKRIVQIQ